MNSGYQLLIFDWDGTLADSEARIVSAMQMAITELKMEKKSYDEIKDIIGLGLQEAAKALFPESSNKEYEKLVENYRAHYLTSTPDETILFPGVYETLNFFLTENILLAVATGKSRRGLEKSFRQSGLGNIFHTSRCADECFSKPHPQMVLEIIDYLGVDKKDTLMIGDTEYDLLMAVNAGISSVAVSYGVHTVERLLQYNPVDLIDHISDLKKVIVNHNTCEVAD